MILHTCTLEFPKITAPICIPSSRSLIIRTPIKRIPQFMETAMSLSESSGFGVWVLDFSFWPQNCNENANREKGTLTGTRNRGPKEWPRQTYSYYIVGVPCLGFPLKSLSGIDDANQKDSHANASNVCC